MEKKKLTVWENRLKRHLPILKWITSYKKSYFVADTIAGLTIGLTLIPQSVAYAALAGVSAEYGLYSSFMGAFIYILFGSVKEVSVGPTSLISLLTFEFTRDLPMEYIFLFTFMCGLIEFLFGLLQFGFLVNFISNPVTTSFQSATSLIIIASQLKDFFGVPRFKSGRFLENISNVIKRISQANWNDFALGCFCCLFLLSLKKLNDLSFIKNKCTTKNKRILKKAIWFVSISRNAICVLLSCLVAYYFTTEEKSPFRLSGNIPAGLPPFRFPQFKIEVKNQTLSFGEVMYNMAPGLFVIPIISILANVTIAKAFSLGSPVDATQEMLTLGICNICGSFVGSLPTCGAFTRSAVSNASGIRTPLAGLFTGTLIILVVNYLTPYFYYIPRATLASVLICAVVFMVDYKTFIFLWKSTKRDFFFAVVTFTVGLLLSIQMGLVIGIALSVGHLLYMWARPNLLVEIKKDDQGSYYLVTPDVGLFFPANDFLYNKVTNKCVENIPIVIDCLHFKGVDFTTAQGLKELSKFCQHRNTKLVFINMSLEIYVSLKEFKVNVQLEQGAIAEEELSEILFKSDKTELPSVILLKADCLSLTEEPEKKTLI